jgi:DNA sulfur modification protein DndD
MRINHLKITNFGPYRGENEFTLRTTPESPIVLFGGKNGAGKTTLFNSVQICLHGQSALGQRTSRSEYEDEIRSNLHDRSRGPAETASIELQFQHANLGKRDTYVVTRTWRDRGKSIAEELAVTKNGKLLSDLDTDQWEDFLKELIPPGVSQLFFFDGEKVQNLASAIEDNSDFESSLRSLLGLDMVERLEADLSIYLSNKLNQEGKSEIQDELEALREEIDSLSGELQEINHSIDDKNNEMGEIDEEIARVEDDLAQQGGAFARKRDEIKDRRTELNTQKENTEEQIREILMTDFPFALAPELCENVRERLQRQTSNRNLISAHEEVTEELTTIAQEEKEIFTRHDISQTERVQLIKDLQSVLEERAESDINDEFNMVSAFSKQQRQRMFAVVERALNTVPEQLAECTAEFETITRELTSTEQKLSRAPDEETISPLIEEITQLNEKRGKIKSQIEDLEDQREEVEGQISHRESKLDRKIEQIAEFEDISDRASLAKRSRTAVQKYQKQLTEKKLTRLEDVLTKRYRQISNKGDFYQQVHIDQDSLEVGIETANDSVKNQSQLSAGERQIFATALIWALSEISDRPLPFIIDTPLGRLDQEHRENLIKHFFPEASHQVIILSTDTEITEEYYKFLTEKSAVEYHLDYNQEEGYTDVSKGYFQDEQMESSIDRPVTPANEHLTIEGNNE